MAHGVRAGFRGAVLLACLLAGCGSAAAPAAPGGDPGAAAASATASARAEVAGTCPPVTDVPPVSADEVDEGHAAGLGLSLEEAARLATDEAQAAAVDAWLRCTHPDAYGHLRVEYAPGFHAVAALTDDAGPDPLRGAPLGVLAGRVLLERAEFSDVEVRVLGARVDAALDACGVGPTGGSVGPAGVEVLAGDGHGYGPGTAAVERCLDAVDLGGPPGREQVEVTDGWTFPA